MKRTLPDDRKSRFVLAFRGPGVDFPVSVDVFDIGGKHECAAKAQRAQKKLN